MVIFEIYVCCQLNIALCKLKLCLQASSLLLHAPSSSVAQRTTIVTPRYRSSFKFRFDIFPFFSLGPQLRHQGVNPLQVFVSTFPLFLSSSLPPASPSSHGGISSGDLLNSQTGQNHPDYLYQLSISKLMLPISIDIAFFPSKKSQMQENHWDHVQENAQISTLSRSLTRSGARLTKEAKDSDTSP